jgi:hypothetical protein
MAASIGQAIALGNIARASQDKPLTNAVMRNQQLDLSRAAAKAKAEEENAKRQQNIMGMVKGKGGFLPMYQEKANQIYASGVNQLMQEKDPIKAQSIANQINFSLEDLQAENQQLAQNLNDARGKGLITQDVFRMFNLPQSEGVKEYNKIVKDHPEIQEIVTLGNNGYLEYNPVDKVDVSKVYGDVVSDLKGTAIPKKDSKGHWEKRQMLDNSYQFVSVASPKALKSKATQLASDITFGKNLRLQRPKEYEAIYKDLAAQAEKSNIQVTQDDLRLAATAKLIYSDLEKDAIYLQEKSNPAPSQFNFGFNGNGGYRTQNKWNLLPADTEHSRSGDFQSTLDAFNSSYGTEYSFEQFYGRSPNEFVVEFDEVVLENQDVSENKTFQYPNGKGGLEDIIPVSIRRPKSGGDWMLVGKKQNPDYRSDKRGSKKFIDVELPYSNAVRQKTDAIVLADTKAVLDKMFPSKPKAKPTSAPKPKADPLGLF